MAAVDIKNAEAFEAYSTQQILAEAKRRLACLKMPEKRIVLVGPPGSGKGSQGQYQRRCWRSSLTVSV